MGIYHSKQTNIKLSEDIDERITEIKKKSSEYFKLQLFISSQEFWEQRNSEPETNMENHPYAKHKLYGDYIQKELDEGAQECPQNDTKSVSIHMLNDDCLKYIFQFLSILERVRVERVCRRWRILSQDSYNTMKTLNLSSSMWGFKTSKSSPSPTEIPLDLFLKILHICGKFLTRLDIFNNQEGLVLHGEVGIIDLITVACPNLEEIAVHDVNKSDIRELAENYRTITKLCLGIREFYCDDELQDLFKINCNLKHLQIEGSTFLNKCLLCLPQNMQSITLSGCFIHNIQNFAIVLARYKDLKILSLKCEKLKFSEPKCKLEDISKHCKDLTVLKLFYNNILTVDSSITNFANLQILRLWYHPISDDFLINLAQHCQQLNCIDITGCSDVTDTGLAALATLLKLEKLSINTLKITGDGLRSICCLKELYCIGCMSFTEENMLMIIISSPQLQVLDVTYCRNITNVTLQVAINACKSRTDNVTLKMYISGSWINASFAANFESLKNLSLYWQQTRYE